MTTVLSIALLAIAASPASSYEVLSDQPARGAASFVQVDAVDGKTGQAIPIRVVVTDSAGGHPDGSGRGVYDDGRFFADGSFTVEARQGKTKIEISHGPNYVPLSFSLDVERSRELHLKASLQPWSAPEARGWYGGDNHVHAQHDENAIVKTDLRYAALQGRANGLSFLTEAGSDVSYADIDKLDTANFLLRYAAEIRPGPYVGHLNTPGIESPIPDDAYRSLVHRPLPAQAVFRAVRERGGVVIHTHPMTPVHQLHWMGAAEAYSDAVLGDCADLFDVDAGHSQQLWFAMLNLGNRIGVSSYTDSALGRTRTLSPGDRRVYCRAERFDYASIVEAMRGGRTMATNGGPVFAFLSFDGHEPGDTVSVTAKTVEAAIEVQSLHPLREVEMYQNGRRVAAFNVNGRQGPLDLRSQIELPQDKPSWLVARAEDQDGKWCVTSPIYFEPPQEQQAKEPPPSAWAILFEINNASRFARLRPQYFAHLIVTVGAGDRLSQVELLRNGERLQVFRASEGDHLSEDRIPVTQMEGEYAEGWIWFPDHKTPRHFQADVPITLSGWYSVVATTAEGKTIQSDAMLYEAANPASHALSIAHVSGPETKLALWGYGEDAPVADLAASPENGQWWYPRNTYWRLQTEFGDQDSDRGWPKEQPVTRFRRGK